MSPFLGITDNVQPKLQRLGKFRKGGEKAAGSNRPGAELDHWRITATDPAVQAACNEIFGLAPKSVLVFLPYPDTQSNFSADGELWDAGGLIHRCDGKTMSVWREDVRMPNGKIKTIYQRGSKPCTGGHIDDDPKRNLVGRLTFIPAIRNPNSGADGIPYIPALALRGFPGAFTMETHSINDCINILGTLSGVPATIDNHGRPIAFELYRYPQEISTPKFDGTAGRSRANKHLVGLRVAPEWYAEQFGGQIMALADSYRESLGAGMQSNALGSGTQYNVNALPAGTPVGERSATPNYSAPAGYVSPPSKAVPPKKAAPVAPVPAPKSEDDEDPSAMFQRPEDQLQMVGEILWPGSWEKAKKKLTDGGITTVSAQLGSVQTRSKELMNESPKTEVLEKHLRGMWPGSEKIIIELAGALADGDVDWKPLEIIRHVSKLYVENGDTSELASSVAKAMIEASSAPKFTEI